MTIRARAALTIASLFLLSSCSTLSGPPRPAWLDAPTRTVDAGYLVYVGTADGRTRDEAMRDAEAVALSDLALECSFVPLGARVEDRFVQEEGYGFRAAAKAATTLEECEAAKKADTPDEIKKLANEPMNALVKRYQDRTTAAPAPDAPPPAAEPEDEAGYYAARQYVFYQKQQIILGGVTYLPGTTMTEEMTQRLKSRIHPILHFERQHPGPIYRSARVPMPMPMTTAPMPMSPGPSHWHSMPRFDAPMVRPSHPRYMVHPRRR